MNTGNSEIVIYQTQDGLTKIDVRMEEENVWLTQMQMATLFQTSKQNISYHINNCFKEGELIQESVVKEFLTTASDCKDYRTYFYNLDVIYKKYQAKTLSAVEKDYLSIIKGLESKAKISN